MQIYSDQNGVQQSTPGSVSIDSDTGMYIFPVIWFEEFDPEKVGGYSVVEGELVWSQEAFDANEALKMEVAATEAAATVQQIKEEAIALLANVTGQPINLLQRAFALTVVKHLNLIRVAKSLPTISPETFLGDLQTILGQL